MSNVRREGTPFYFATQQPPSATVRDEDIFLTITAAAPPFPGHLETVDVILSIDFAKHVIAELEEAVEFAMKNFVH